MSGVLFRVLKIFRDAERHQAAIEETMAVADTRLVFFVQQLVEICLGAHVLALRLA